MTHNLFGSGISQILIFEIGISMGYPMDFFFETLSSSMEIMDFPKNKSYPRGQPDDPYICCYRSARLCQLPSYHCMNLYQRHGAIMPVATDWSPSAKPLKVGSSYKCEICKIWTRAYFAYLLHILLHILHIFAYWVHIFTYFCIFLHIFAYLLQINA